MGETLVNILPLELTAGLTFTARVSSVCFAPPVWSLSLVLRGASSINVTSTPESGEHLLNVPAATTNAWTPGEYKYSLRATDGTDVRELEAGRITVLPSLESIADGSDVRRQAEITLANIEALLQGRATTDQQRYVIGTRELWRTPIPELLQLRAVYRAQVAHYKRKELGLSPFGQVIRPVL